MLYICCVPEQRTSCQSIGQATYMLTTCELVPGGMVSLSGCEYLKVLRMASLKHRDSETTGSRGDRSDKGTNRI